MNYYFRHRYLVFRKHKIGRTYVAPSILEQHIRNNNFVVEFIKWLMINIITIHVLLYRQFLFSFVISFPKVAANAKSRRSMPIFLSVNIKLET
ncbi:hypothetical protein ACJIZ3_014311 [Penstemon smallii]|uniref:Uncharacterized protein n=1 Tax=Penstemon smallii TaxID=265156 RepID=A0ABD3RJK4_9LAMI